MLNPNQRITLSDVTKLKAVSLAYPNAIEIKFNNFLKTKDGELCIILKS